jgi:(E)-4-hydroxy-3-methylbut-2-enyl-diphosphate synthase
MVKGEVVANLDEKELVDRFISEVEKMASEVS